MRIELTELLRCPRCASTAGLVALIERADGGRVLEGDLGCPFCEARYPVRAGEVDLTGRSEQELDSGVGVLQAAEAWRGGADPAQGAIALAALLGLQEDRGGYVLLDETLCPLAERVARLGRGTDIVTLVPSGLDPSEEAGSAAPSGVGGTAASRVRVDAGAVLPILSGRLAGIALFRPDMERLKDALRALRTDGRLVVLEPDSDVPSLAQDTGLRVLVADEAALVAVRDPVSA